MEPTAIPETVLNAVQLGAGVIVLALLATFPRLAVLFPLFVLLLGAWAMHLGVLSPAWALDSLINDAPWVGVVRVAAVQVVVAVAAAWMLRRRAGQVLWMGLASPVLAAHPAVRERWTQAVPDDRQRAGIVLLGGSLGLAIPALSPGAGLLGWYADPAVAVGVVVIGLAAFLRTRRPAPFLDKGTPWRPWGPLGAVLCIGPALGMMAWLAAASGALEFVADALEQAKLYVPRITEGMFVLGATLVGSLGDEGAWSLVGAGILERGLSLRGEQIREILLAGVSVGGTLPMLVATRSRLKVGVPWWLAQVVWVVGWYLLH